MVRDNNTGLIWEVKATDDSAINYNYDTYAWQAAQNVFIAGLNSDSYGTYTDWRMPTIMELSTIVNDGTSNPAINEDYFPNSFADTSYPGLYWTSTSYNSDSSQAWMVFFEDYDGYDVTGVSSKLTAYSVRAVRGAQFRTGGFVNNGNGTVTDTYTGLMWAQNPIQIGYPDWSSSMGYCEDLTLPLVAGYTDWRMPNRIELQSLVDYTRSDPAINTGYFPSTMYDFEAAYGWTSTTIMGATSQAWCVDFSNGDIISEYKSDYYFGYVQAVRGGQ